jgi:hypothetical protein
MLSTEIQGLVLQAVNQCNFDSVRLMELKEEFEEYKRKQDKKFNKLESELENIKKNRRLTDESTTGPCKCSQSIKVNLNLRKVEASYQDFVSIVHEEWTNDSYTPVGEDKEDAITIDTEDAFYFCNLEETNKTNLTRKVLNKYPEIKEGQKIPCKGGSYTTLEQHSYIKTNTGKVAKIKRITAIFYDNDEELENIFNICGEIKNLALNADANRITVATPTTMKTDLAKKIIEYVFHDTEVRVVLKISRDARPKPAKKKDETIIIDKEAESYADTLKKIKEGLNQDEKSLIKNVRETKKGNIVIKVDKDAKEVSNMIGKVLENRKLGVRKGKN